MSRKKGFTLVELMITIVIMGILAAAAGVAYNAYIRRAKMAQAYQNIDALTKAEVSYFMSNKSFRSLVNNPMTPEGKLPSKTPLALRDFGDWNEFGNPLTPGSNQFFMNEVIVGRTDGSGAERNDESDCSSNAKCFITIGMGDPMFGGTKVYKFSAQGDLKPCEPVPLLKYIQPAGKPLYNWAMIVEGADMREGKDASLSEAKCTYIFKVLDTNSAGKVNGGGPIASINLGE